ncbi:MAG TPA: protealysin inhibitor emfourin [Longimicrobium sp.]|jgi:hypothetical protein
MKVTLETYGGFAAGIQRAPRTVDAERLPSADASELARRVAEAAAAPVPGEAPGAVRDAMSYTITVEDEGKHIVLEQSDGALSPEFASLLEWIEKAA